MPRLYTTLVLSWTAVFQFGLLEALVLRVTTNDGVTAPLGFTRYNFFNFNLSSHGYSISKLPDHPATQTSEQRCPAATATFAESPADHREQGRPARLNGRYYAVPPIRRQAAVWTGGAMDPKTSPRRTGSLGVAGRGAEKDVLMEGEVAKSTEGDEGRGADGTPFVSWLSLAMLLLVYVSNQWSRSLVYYVQNFDVAATTATAKEFMNVDIGFDETQYGKLAKSDFTHLIALLIGARNDGMNLYVGTYFTSLLTAILYVRSLLEMVPMMAGLLASFSFTLLFSACSLIAGRAVDVVSRKTVTVGSCAVWSAMALGTAFTESFLQVFGLRVLQGSSQAFTTPAAYTMISDLFPASTRGTANAIYSSGVYLGGALASLSLLLNGAVGWRESHIVVAIVGFAIALLSALLIREPERESAVGVVSGGGEKSTVSKYDGEAAPSLVYDPATVNSNTGKTAETETATDVAVGENEALLEGGADEKPRESFLEALAIVFESGTVKLLFAATAFRFCAGFGIGVWCAPFFRGRFPSFTSEFSVLNAFVVAGGGLFSSFLGGFISDKYSAQDPRARAWVPMVGSLLAVPCWMGVVSGANFYVSLAFLLAEYVVAECWFGPTVTILQEGLPSTVRGVGQGVFSTLSAFGTLAPPLMGALIQRGGFQQQDVLLWTVGGFYAVSAVFFFFVGESVLADHRRAGEFKEA